MTVINRIFLYIKEVGLNNSRFEKLAGLPNGYVSKIKGSPGVDKIEDILRTFPDLNRDWLLYGDGEMLRSEKKNENNLEVTSNNTHLIPVLPIVAQGGSLNDFTLSVKASDCEQIVSPIRGADFAMSIAGDSMAPEFPSGSQVLVKKIDEKAFIEWGKTYVLDTCNGSVVKVLMPSDTPNKVTCVSINKDYPPFEVSFESIYGIYRVMMIMAIK